MDPLTSSSTGASTDGTGLVTPPQASPLPAQQMPSVNPAQTISQPTPPSTTTVQPADVSTLIAQYEARIRNLMSEKDKAINERNTTISQLTSLQKEHDDFRAMNTASLSASVENAQAAIDAKKVLEQQVAALTGETLRAKTLLEKPHLAPYAQFIPASGDPEKVKQAVEQLEQIRASDLQRSLGLAASNHAASASSPGTPAAGNGGPTQAVLPNGQVDPAFASLYAGRANLPSSLVSAMPGSTPAQLNPAALTDPNAEIARLFDDARRTGRQEDFDRALAQAQVLANAAIAQQLGRSS